MELKKGFEGLSMKVETTLNDSLQKSIDRTTQAFQKLWDGVRQACEAMGGIITNWSLRNIGISWVRLCGLGLVSDRVINLSYRKGKTGKKNLNRIRKEIRLHNKRNPNNPIGIRSSERKEGNNT